MKSIYEQALELWGEDAQLRLAQEECAELIVAINHRQRSIDHRPRHVPSDDFIIEEIADVEIMIEQLKTIFGAEKVAAAKKIKIERLIDRMKLRIVVEK